MDKEEIVANILNGNISLAKEQLKRASKVEVLETIAILRREGIPYHSAILDLIKYCGGGD